MGRTEIKKKRAAVRERVRKSKAAAKENRMTTSNNK